MLTLTLKLLIWSSFISIYLVNKTTLAQPSFLWHYCNETCKYNASSSYETELKTSLSSLPNTSSDIGFFSSSTIQVNSVALCRGDVNPDVCLSCLKDAILELPSVCTDQKEAIGFYDSCLLKYSDQQIKLLKTDPETKFVANLSQISNDVDQFNDALSTLLANLSQKAAGGSSKLKYATGQMASRPDLLTNALVQCDPEMLDLECNSCLEDSINNIMKLNGSMSGRILKPMCNIRYYTDDQFVMIPSPPPVLQPSPPPGNKTEKSKKWTLISVVVVIPLILLICLGILWYIKKRKHRREEYERRKRDEYFLELTASRSFKDVHQLETDGGKGNDLLLFSFASIMTATNDFSVENKLGQGGFGPVYKGKLSDGREIAIKRGKGLWNSRMN